MLPENDDRFEQYLRHFEPLPPGPLPDVQLSSSARWRAPLATAALVILSVGMLLWRAALPNQTIFPSASPAAASNAPAAATIGGLNRLLRENPSQMEAQITSVSRRLLPNVERPGSTLGALAK